MEDVVVVVDVVDVVDIVDVVDVADGVIGKSRIQLNLNQERKTTAAAEAALNWSRNFLRQLIVRVPGYVAKRFKCSVFL